MRPRALTVPLCAALCITAPVGGQEERVLRADDFKALAWRSVGPANMGGRVAALALAPDDPKTLYVGFATGGLWKTTNHGTTYAPIFDDHETSSIGAVGVVDDVVWVGTGEGNGRNSSSWGHGVYRSADGGEHFEHVGLADAHDIPALAVDPRDPDVCYVAALGHLWGANEERGVYKTTDGGATWAPVLRIDADTGACDVILSPGDPDVVYAAMYTRRRTIHSYRSGGPEGGIYRSPDGGATWTKLAGGLPAQTGRIGLDVSRSDPDVVLAVVESDEGGRIGDPFTDRQRTGGVFRSEDGGDTWERTSDFNPRSFYFSRIRVDPRDPRRVYLLGWKLYVSDDGGRTFRAATKVPHVDYHAMVIDPDDTDHLVVGNDGGVYVSWDRGKTWDFHHHMAVGQFYNVAVDMSDPYRIGGGLQDNGTWIGPSETITFDDGKYMGRAGAITDQDWRYILGGDGFHVAFDPEDPDVVYAEWQGGHILRTNLGTGQQWNLRPSPKEGEPRYRFNWNAPFLISPHDPATLYLGGNCVFRLGDRGERWKRISDDLSGRDPAQFTTVASEAETANTIVALAESPLAAGRLWAGTDDGRVHTTGDGGATWSDVTPDAVGGLYVSKIEPSRHDADTAYVAVDGHRSDVFTPILLATTDAGRSWTSIAGDLPDGAPPKVVREDPRAPDVLYVGTERAAYVTIDRGARWVRLNGNTLPTVAVDDLVVHPREADVVAGTHGRSVWILDDASPISQLTPEIIRSDLHAFTPLPAQPRHRLGYGGLWSDRMFLAKNPPAGAVITYWLAKYVDEKVEIAITAGDEENGDVVRKLKGTSRPGFNRVTWDLQREEIQRLGSPHEMKEFVEAGTYRVKITAGDLEAETEVEVRAAPGVE
jgi:photosystem II stability/assembly factor-like uncharacterized protein